MRALVEKQLQSETKTIDVTWKNHNKKLLTPQDKNNCFIFLLLFQMV